MLSPIHVTHYYALVREHDRYIRLLRTEVAYPSAAAVDNDMVELEAALRDLPADRLLLDLRGGPAPRNDAAFEVAQQNFRAALHRRFKRIAVLCRSNVGVLQIRRLCRAEGLFALPFTDETEATQYLSEPAPAAAARRA